MNNNEQQLIRAISPERLQKYMGASKGDSSKALELYKENAILAASFYPFLQGIEITLRNAIHREMSAKWGENWFDKAPLGRKEREMIEKSIRYLQADFTSGHLLADLSFGFWIRLLSTHYYQALWVPCLYKCFKIRKHQKQIHAQLVDVLDLRNRIAHYEPIFMRDLKDDKHKIIEAIEWLEPEMAKWLRE